MLQSNGHADVGTYPLWALSEEAAIVRRRTNQDRGSEMSLLHKAVGAVLSQKAFKGFAKDLKMLSE